MKKPTRKLVLRAENIRVLARLELEHAVGGDSGPAMCPLAAGDTGKVMCPQLG